MHTGPEEQAQEFDLADVMYVWPMVVKKIYLEGGVNVPDSPPVPCDELPSDSTAEPVYVSETLVHSPEADAVPNLADVPTGTGN